MRASGVWLLLPFSTIAHAAVTNRTIDDQQGDAVTGLKPSYSGNWNYGPECAGCLVQPDASRAFDTSWHDTTIDPPADPSSFPSVTLTFTGTAVYVFAIVPNTVEFATTFTNMTFTLDGTLADAFLYSPNISDVYEYDVPVYTTQALDNVQHTLKVEAQAGTQGSYLAFDYAIYTFDDSVTTTSSSSSSSTTTSTTSSDASSSTSSVTSPTPSPTGSKSSTSHKSSTPVAAIAGGVVGGVAVLATLLLLLFCLRRRKRKGVDAIQRVPRSRHSDIDAIDGAKIEPFRPDMSQRDPLASEPVLAGGPASDRRRPRRRPSGPSTVAPDDTSSPFVDRAANASSTSLGTSFPGSHYGYGVGAGAGVGHSPLAPGATATSSSGHGHRPREGSVGSLGATSSAPSSVPTPLPATVLGLANGPSRARSQKAAQRHRELARQVSEMEQTVASLNAQRTPASPVRTSDGGADALRLQVEALQLEVERLKDEQEEQRLLAMEPPPAYEHAPEPASEGDREDIRALPRIPT